MLENATVGGAGVTHPERGRDSGSRGAGGVGLLLTRMAKTLGARVTATMSTREKASLSLEAGADEVLQYTEVDFAEKINAAGRRMKAVYNSVGKPTFLKSLLCLEERGTVVL